MSNRICYRVAVSENYNSTCESMSQGLTLDKYVKKCFFYDCAIDNDTIYFPMANYNALCKANIRNGLGEIIDIFPNEDNQSLLHCGIYKADNYLLISVYKGKNRLLIYDVCEKNFEVIHTDGIEKSWLNFTGNQIVSYGSYLYIFPYRLVVLKINMNKFTAEYFTYPDIKPEEDTLGQVLRVKNKVYLPLMNRNIIYTFDLENETFNKVCLEIDINGIATIEFDGNDFWLTGKNRGLFSWNKEKSLYTRFDIFPKGFGKIIDCEYNCFSDSIYFENYLYLIPAYANMIVRYDIKNKKMHEIYVSDEEENEKTIKQPGRFFWAKYRMAKRINDKIILLSSKTKHMYILDMRTQKMEKIDLDLHQDMSYKRKILGLGSINEDVYTNGLEDYIKVLIEGDEN